MLSCEVIGDGPPVLLLHGTMGSRLVWEPIRERLARKRRLILIDLPGMGGSPVLPGANIPPDWIEAIGEVLDSVGAPCPAVVGHSMGGWTALELAKHGRAASVLALAPAGLWIRSPRYATFSLRMGWLMARAVPSGLAVRGLSLPAVRRIALRDGTVNARAVRPAWAATIVSDARRSRGFRAHLGAARRSRFEGGGRISVPVRVVFAGRDRLTTPAAGQLTDQLPQHAVIERWDDCGHVVIWDAMERVVEAVLALPTQTPSPDDSP